MNMESLEQEYWCNQLDDLTSSKLQPNGEQSVDPEEEYDDQEEPDDHQNIPEVKV